MNAPKPSTKFLLRLPLSLREDLDALALAEGTSRNSLIVLAVNDKVREMRARADQVSAGQHPRPATYLKQLEHARSLIA